MKKCPTCNQIYDVSENYCANDGATLIFEQPPGNPSFPNPDQVVSPPFESLNVTSGQSDNSKWLYLIIGILSSVIFSLLIGFFIWTKSDKNTASANTPAAVENKASSVTETKKANSPMASNQTNEPANNTFSPLVIDNEQNKKEITERLFDWKNTAESRDLNSYMNNYAETVDYYRKNNAGKSFVRNDKQRAFSKFDSIKINLDIISISPDSLGVNAAAIIDKEWVFEGESYLTGKVRQEIRLRKINGEWLINGEKDLKVFYLNK